MSDLLRRRAMMQQSRGKTMQLLAEYTVTEPVYSFQIPFTKQMQECNVLLCEVDLTETDESWVYTGHSSAESSYYPKGTSVKDAFCIFMQDSVQIAGTTFSACSVFAPNANSPVKINMVAAQLFFRMYRLEERIKAGTVKIYGEV